MTASTMQLMRASGRSCSIELLLPGFESCRRLSRQGQLPGSDRALHQISGGNASPEQWPCHYLRAHGPRNEARNILAQLLQAREKRYISAPVIAAVTSPLATKKKAFRWLERAFAEHSGILQWIAFLPEFRPLHFRCTFPPPTAANRRCAELNFGDHGDNSTEITDPNGQTHLT